MKTWTIIPPWRQFRTRQRENFGAAYPPTEILLRKPSSSLPVSFVAPCAGIGNNSCRGMHRLGQATRDSMVTSISCWPTSWISCLRLRIVVARDVDLQEQYERSFLFYLVVFFFYDSMWKSVLAVPFKIDFPFSGRRIRVCVLNVGRNFPTACVQDDFTGFSSSLLQSRRHSENLILALSWRNGLSCILLVN